MSGIPPLAAACRRCCSWLWRGPGVRRMRSIPLAAVWVRAAQSAHQRPIPTHEGPAGHPCSAAAARSRPLLAGKLQQRSAGHHCLLAAAPAVACRSLLAGCSSTLRRPGVCAACSASPAIAAGAAGAAARVSHQGRRIASLSDMAQACNRTGLPISRSAAPLGQHLLFVRHRHATGRPMRSQSSAGQSTSL